MLSRSTSRKLRNGDSSFKMGKASTGAGGDQGTLNTSEEEVLSHEKIDDKNFSRFYNNVRGQVRKYLFHLKGRHYRYETLQI